MSIKKISMSSFQSQIFIQKEGWTLLAKFFDWLSNLRPRQLFMLAGGSAIIIFFIMYMALTMISRHNVPINVIIDETTGETQPIPEVRMKSVVVANRNIEPKTMILARMLEMQEFPENSLPPDVVTDIAEISNKPAKERIFKGDVITQQKVYRNAEQAGFVGSIPPDCRAVSINLNDVTGVAGFAKPGDYVDVLLIERDDEVVSSRLILQDVLLLSINKSMGVENNPSGGEGQENQENNVNPATKAIENPALATLALRPDEVLQLVSASRIGEIYLMLRPLVPQSDYITGAEYTIKSLKGQRTQEQAKVQVEPEKRLSLEEQIVEGKKQTNSDNPNVSPENKIEIIYGDK